MQGLWNTCVHFSLLVINICSVCWKSIATAFGFSDRVWPKSKNKVDCLNVVIMYDCVSTTGRGWIWNKNRIPAQTSSPAASAAVLSPSHPWCSDEPCGSRSGFPFTKTILSPYTNLGCDPVRMLLPLHARTAQHQHNNSSSNRVPGCPVSRRRSPRKRAKRSHCFY